MITVTGATGNIGRKITEKLLHTGQKVRCVARNPERLEAFATRGAEIAAIDLLDAAALTRVFSGSQAVFAMIPPNYQAENFRIYQNQVGENIAKAIETAGVKYVVNLSSQGGDLPDKTGPIKGLHDQEKRLNLLKRVHILHLRPTYFMENLLAFADMIRNSNMAGSAIRGDLKFPMIATRDIADFAAERLIERDFEGIIVEDLLGERDLSMNEAVRIIGDKIGKSNLKYMQFSYEDTRKALVDQGFSPDVAGLFIEMSRAFNDGLIHTSRTAENTTETSFEEFSDIFVHMLRNV